MNYVKIAVLGLALSSGGATAADCSVPEAPTLPDGSAATMEDMLAGQKAVKTYQSANLEYMSCLDPLIAAAGEKAAGDGASEDDHSALKALEEQYNAAVSKEEELAGQFNTEIREYKAANPG